MMGTGFGIGHQVVLSAEKLEYKLDDFEINVETAYDTRGKMMLGTFYTGGIWFKYGLNIQSPEPAERTVELLNHLEKNCRTTATLGRPVELIPHVMVNGKDINYTLPELASPEALMEERGLEAQESVFERGDPQE